MEIVIFLQSSFCIRSFWSYSLLDFVFESSFLQFTMFFYVTTLFALSVNRHIALPLSLTKAVARKNSLKYIQNKIPFMDFSFWKKTKR